ncbi:unknown [Feldmannia species virus]|uniref:Uncharacterized protein n=1 Tax=Feldmannia species virus TaxID=39420 RepID=B5LWG4_9PHYC|nr:hypothetical protein FeldSpV_gp075 [Feldmannia species virus]ACH46827.1 unknown [Feldmannia species virus]
MTISADCLRNCLAACPGRSQFFSAIVFASATGVMFPLPFILIFLTRSDRFSSSRIFENDDENLSERVKKIKINGRGNITPVADAKTIAEKNWLLPGHAAKQFRRQSAEIVMRVLGGDTTLCNEIEKRCVDLQSTSHGEYFQNFALGGKNGEKRFGGELMEHASQEDFERNIFSDETHLTICTRIPLVPPHPTRCPAFFFLQNSSTASTSGPMSCIYI